MNLLSPVSELMTTDLITVNPEDKLSVVNAIFENHRIHHVPVVRFRKIIGIISKTDFLHFLKGMGNTNHKDPFNHGRLLKNTASDIMTEGIAKLEPTDRIDVALDVFKINLFHALPVVENDELVGIITTHDIITALADKKLLV